MEEEQRLTVQEAAAWLGVRDTAVRNAISRGRLASEVKYGRILVKKSDLESYKQNARPGRPKKSDN